MDNPVLVSIIGGLLVALIIWAGSRFFLQVILPWYLTVTYDGPKLGEEWSCHYRGSNSTSPSQIISLKQEGPRLTGIIEIRKWADDSDANEQMTFAGSIKGEKAIITYESEKQPKLFFGMLIFKIQDSAKRLEGWALGVEPTDMGIYAEKRIWTEE